MANAYSRIEPGGILTCAPGLTFAFESLLTLSNSSSGRNQLLALHGHDELRPHHRLRFATLGTHLRSFADSAPIAGSYWLIPLQGITVGGVSVFSGGDSDSVAVDTGTSECRALPCRAALTTARTGLIGGPPSAIQAIYGAIPNSRAVQISGQSGYWAYPCATQVKVAMTFGGVAYDINPVDFNAGACYRSFHGCTVLTSGLNRCRDQQRRDLPRRVLRSRDVALLARLDCRRDFPEGASSLSPTLTFR